MICCFFKFFATVALSTASVLGGSSSSYGPPSQDFGAPIGVLSGGGGGGYDEPNTAAGGQVHRHVSILKMPRIFWIRNLN